jgi:arylsulfatase A-like enzyme
MGEFGLYNKMWMYEESLRIPLLVRYPGHVQPGSVNDDFISMLDFAPTFADYGHAEPAAEFQGASFREILETGNAPDTWREAHYYHYYGNHDVPPHIGVRTAEYKLIHYYEKDAWELFDLKNDPHEIQNVYGNPEKAAIVAWLKKELEALRHEYESPMAGD